MLLATADSSYWLHCSSAVTPTVQDSLEIGPA